MPKLFSNNFNVKQCTEYFCLNKIITAINKLRVFENRRIFGSQKENSRKLKKLLHEDIHNLYTSPNIIWMIKSRRVRCNM